MVEGTTANKGDVLLMVGTRKGSFLISSSPNRRNWNISGPHIPGPKCSIWLTTTVTEAVSSLPLTTQSGGRNWSIPTTWEATGPPLRSSPGSRERAARPSNISGISNQDETASRR